MPQQLLADYQQRINHFLEEQLNRRSVIDPQLHQAMSYGLLLGGKRARPFLVYATGTMLGASLEKLDHCAAAVECIHAYSLIHDDLPAMDDDELRRGHATCHIKFDEATAILAGDALQTMAFELLSQELDLQPVQQLQLIRHLSAASGSLGMCGGQALDMDATNQSIDLAQLEDIHQYKTGALITAAVMMGAIAADANATELAALERYARAIGLAFQVQDDILDLIGDTEILGKPQGSDEQANKSTYPALLGLEQAQQKAHALVEEALQALATLPYNSQPLAGFARYIIDRNH